MATPPSPLWPVHPKPLTGEALSSWLLRVADGNGLAQSTFKRYLPKAKGAGADLDLIDDQTFLTAIAGWSAIPQEQIAALGFASDEGRVFIRRTASHPDWIIPRNRQGIWPEKRHVASQPFCPSCLASDATPYYRKAWRYAFHPICPEHGLLADRCAHCGQSFSYLAIGNALWNPFGTQALRQCTACGASFAKTHQTDFNALEQRALATQSALLDGLTAGWIRHGNELIPIALFLRGLRILAEALLNPEHGTTICAWIAAHLPDLDYENASCPGKGILEERPSFTRAWLNIFAFWMSQEWPNRWISLIRETGLPASISLPHWKSLPSWMHSDDLHRLRARNPRRTSAEIESAKTLLGRIRGWPSNMAEVAAFMKTGIVPAIKPPSRPILPASHMAFNRLTKASSAGSATKRDDQRLLPIKELYPTSLQGDPLSELLEDMDDTETTMSAFKRKQRSKQEKS